MNNLELKTFVLGSLETNCYLVFDDNTKKAFVVDAGEGSSVINDFATENNLEILFIALTHGHFDHIFGLSVIAKPFYIHNKDSEFLSNPAINGSMFFDAAVTVKSLPNIIDETKPLKFGPHNIEIIHTPGHTPGSVCFKLRDWLFTGDTLFFSSVGRTDIALASHSLLINSIKEKILTLPEETLIYPGHGKMTSVRAEKESNPFLSDR
jgi:glyoxylase-like metal-dependent hydrolase (beta-lactamase superfamily II)